MFLIDLLFAALVAIVIGSIFAFALDRPGPWTGLWAFFLLLFLFTWAGGVWIAPFGPVLWGGYLLPFLLIGLLVALLIAAASPPPPPRTPGDIVAEARAEETMGVALTVFFWVVLGLLLMSLIAHYV